VGFANATTPPRIASDLADRRVRSMSSQMAISGEAALERRPRSLLVSDGRGVSSDRQPAILGRSQGAAVASGVRCRAYGVRTAA
jgi:hypothetical protein